MRIPGFSMAVAFALAAATGPAVAQTAAPAITADDFQAGTTGALGKLCSAAGGDAATRAAGAYYCHGFLSGVAQFHRSISQSGGPITPIFCAPQPPPSLQQVSSDFASWVQANPQYAAEPAVDGLARFAQTRYPCPTPPPAAARPTRGR